MIEEQGRVVALENGAVWIETVRRSACSGCAARSGCGQGLMDRLGVRERRGLVLASCDLPVKVGDNVVIGIREEALLLGSALVYLFPLLMLIVAAIVADRLFAQELWSIVAGLAAFLLSWPLVRWRSRLAREAIPVVMRPVFAGEPSMR